MSTIHVTGTTNDDLISGLRSPDPAERLKCAEATGEFHLYLALPHLLDMVRADADITVREAARRAVIALMPSQEAAESAIAGDPPTNAASEYSSQREHATSVIWLFERYLMDRTTSTPGLTQDDLVGPVIGYLAGWASQDTHQLDAVGLAAAAAIGAVARFLEIPNESAGVKYMSFRDAKARVAEYDRVRASHGDAGED